jgi:hypothetical protein
MTDDVDDLLAEVEGALGRNSRIPGQGGARPGPAANSGARGPSLSRTGSYGQPSSSVSAAAAPRRAGPADPDDIDNLLSLTEESSPTRGGGIAFGAGALLPPSSSSGAAGWVSAHSSSSRGSASVAGSASVGSSSAGSASALAGGKCKNVYVGAGAAEEVGGGGGRSSSGASTPTAGVPPRACSALRCTACDFVVERFVGASWSPSADYMFFRNTVPNRAKLERMLVRGGGGGGAGAASYCCQCSWLSVEPAGSGDALVLIRRAGTAVSPATAGQEAQRLGVRLSPGGQGWATWTCGGGHSGGGGV